MLGKKSVFLLDCHIFFQTSCSTAEIVSEEVMAKVESREKESLILKAKCFFLLWLFQFFGTQGRKPRTIRTFSTLGNFRSIKIIGTTGWCFYFHYHLLTKNTLKFHICFVINGAPTPRSQEKVREMVEAHSQSRQATSSALQRAGASTLEKNFKKKLGGGFKYFLFSPLLGEMIKFE